MEKTQVTNYLLLGECKSDNFKKVKRKLKKKGYAKYFSYKTIEDFKNEAPKTIDDYLKNKDDIVGILCDTNIIIKNITLLPPLPKEWDVLCLQSTVKEYDFTNQNSNVYWTATSLIDTHNFIINKKSFKVVSKILKQASDWTDMINKFNDLKTFTITQFFFSEELKHHVHFSSQQYNSKATSENDKQLLLDSYKQQYLKKLLDDMTYYSSNTNQYNQNSKMLLTSNHYPNISLICILEDKTRFFHLLNTFLRLNYPRDKLELIIIDDQDLEKQVKHIVPQDERIKMINITQKTNKQRLPLGYKLNIGVKYSSHDICCHFLDSNTYYGSKFEQNIKHYILSGKDIVCSIDTGIYPKYIVRKPDIANMIYHKRVWNANCFEDYENDENILLYKYLYFRYNCVSFIPFIYMSFISNYTEKIESLVPLPFSLLQTVDPNILVSFSELNQKG